MLLSRKVKILIDVSFITFIFIRQNINFSENWKKYQFNPVLGNNKTGSLFDPFVFFHEGLYKMYVSWRSKGSIAFSQSKDGINWSDLKIVLEKGNKTSWESIVNRACIILINGKFYLWYRKTILGNIKEKVK